jgi:hypothetical protein
MPSTTSLRGDGGVALDDRRHALEDVTDRLTAVAAIDGTAGHSASPDRRPRSTATGTERPGCSRSAAHSVVRVGQTPDPVVVGPETGVRAHVSAVWARLQVDGAEHHRSVRPRPGRPRRQGSCCTTPLTQRRPEPGRRVWTVRNTSSTRSGTTITIRPGPRPGEGNRSSVPCPVDWQLPVNGATTRTFDWWVSSVTRHPAPRRRLRGGRRWTSSISARDGTK